MEHQPYSSMIFSNSHNFLNALRFTKASCLAKWVFSGKLSITPVTINSLSALMKIRLPIISSDPNNFKAMALESTIPFSVCSTSLGFPSTRGKEKILKNDASTPR